MKAFGTRTIRMKIDSTILVRLHCIGLTSTVVRTGKLGLKSPPNQVRVISRQQRPLNGNHLLRPSFATVPSLPDTQSRKVLIALLVEHLLVAEHGRHYLPERAEIHDENQGMQHLIYVELNEKRQINFVED